MDKQGQLTVSSIGFSDLFQHLTRADAELVVRLRLIIARAAQPDSLNWWDDRSLTAEGFYLAERLFARRPIRAAATIALRTARSRHAAVVPAAAGLHLYELGNEFEYDLTSVAVEEAWIPTAPFASSEAMLEAFAALVPEGAGYASQYSAPRETLTGLLEIQLSPEADPPLKPKVAQACALALAYGEAGLGRPVFPYLKR